MSFKLNHFLILLLLAFASCVEPFNPDFSETELSSQLVIEGRITTIQEPYIVRISRTVPLDSTFNFNAESNAKVLIREIEGGTTQLIETDPGIYQTTDSTFVGKTGHVYRLEITTADGMQYESTDMKIIPVPEVEKLYFDREEIPQFNTTSTWIAKNRINFYIDTNDPSGECQYFKWEFRDAWEHYFTKETGMSDEKVYCWDHGKSTEIVIGSIKNNRANRIIKKKVNTLTDQTLKLLNNYGFMVEQCSLSKDAHDYLANIKKQNDSNGNLHETAPHSLLGNVSCCQTSQKMLGYFYATDVKTKFLRVGLPGHRMLDARGPLDYCPVHIVEDDDFEIRKYRARHGTMYILSRFTENKRRYLRVTPFLECSDCRITGQPNKPWFWEK